MSELLSNLTPLIVFLIIAAILSNIEKVVMIDHGGGEGNGGGSGLNRFAQTGPTMIYSLLRQLQALGLNVPEILKQLSTAEKTSEAIVVDNGDSANETKKGSKSPA